MLADDVTITRITEDRRYTNAQELVKFLRIEFMVGRHGPFTEKFDKPDYTLEARDQKLNDFAATVRTP